MGEIHKMANERKSKEPLYSKFVRQENRDGSTRSETGISLIDWDTREMPDYVQGSNFKVGHSILFTSIKSRWDNSVKGFVNKKSVFSIDPSNKELRKAIIDCYSEFDKIQKR